MNCAEFMNLMDTDRLCEETEFGAKYVTHCLYPSADPVAVFVSRWGKGFRVSDGGGAAKSAWQHGRDDNVLLHAFKKVRDLHAVDCRGGMLLAEIEDEAWLYPAILAVANASALAASLVLDQLAASADKELSAEIKQQLLKVVPESLIASQYGFRGQSGKLWSVDYAVVGRRTILLKAVSPHHASISAGYTAFGDIGEQEAVSRMAVFKRGLKPEDAALMRQVSELLPVSSVAAATRRETERTPLN